MKKLILLSALALFCISATGCGAMIAMGGGGLLYQDTKTPSPAVAYHGATSNSMGKMGTASCSSILGLLVTGDASLEAAMKSGGITKVHHIDQQVTNILGIIATYKVIVYGE